MVVVVAALIERAQQQQTHTFAAAVTTRRGAENLIAFYRSILFNASNTERSQLRAHFLSQLHFSRHPTTTIPTTLHLKYTNYKVNKFSLALN